MQNWNAWGRYPQKNGEIFLILITLPLSERGRVVQLKIRTKLYFGFGAVLLLMIIMVVISLHLNREVETANNEAIAKMEEIIVGLEREVDHLTWQNNLADSLILHREFTGELDYTQCEFGQWYYALLESEDYAALPDEFKETLERIERPHTLLHQSAERIVQVFARMGHDSEEAHNRALSIYILDAQPSIDELMSLMGELRGQMEAERQRYIAFTLERASLARQILLVASLISLLTGFGAAFFISRGITGSLRMVVNSLEELCKKGGDLTGQINVKTKDEMNDLAYWFNTFVDKIRGIIITVRDSTDKVSRYSETMAATSQELSASMEEVSASANEFAGSAQNLNTTAHEMEEAGNSVLQNAGEGRMAVENVLEQMKQITLMVKSLKETVINLDTRAQNINKIVDTIKGIADQTNLLALNAAIEAARAGEQGKGFAVVAEEVRKLAEQSANSAAEITELIAGTQDETNNAVKSMEKGEHTVAKGTEVVQATGELLGNIISRIEDIAGKIQDVADASRDIGAGSQQLSSSMEEQTASMEEISSTAAELQGLVTELSEILDQFKC